MKFAERNTSRFSQQDQSIAVPIVRLLPCGEEEVYDLTVPLVKNFTIENGIIVHNSADELRYFLQTLRDQHPMQPKNKIEQYLEKLKQQEENFNFNYNKQ